jgi:hypothetical protein
MMPPNREGVASGVLNVSREVFGLLGVTVLGAVLSTRQTARLADGVRPLTAFLDAYQFALVIAAVIVAIGVPVALFSLRNGPTRPTVTAQASPVSEPVA